MKTLTILIILFLAFSAPALAQYQYPFQDPALDTEKRIDNVLSLMTLDEKISSLGTSGVAVPRLGIRGTAIGEALSGVVLGGPMQKLIEAFPGVPESAKTLPTPTTQFPQGVGLARTWDPDLVRQAGAVIGSEARYIFENGENAHAFLVLLTPNADLARDPRWGRTQESYGEDPFFNGTMAAALIRGIQGDNPKYWQAASLLKHFLANSNEHGRYGSSSDFDVRLLREYYSVPFRMGFEDGGARAYMASYNAWNHVPMTVNPILENITVKEWGVDGIICTDAGSLGNLVSQHKAYPNLKEAAAASIKAGINMFLTIFEDYKTAVKAALADHLITEADLDTVLRGSVRTALRLGLLDPPSMVPYSKLKGAPNPVNSPQHNAIALEVARESVVLLKNTQNLLPLDRHAIKTVAVIGPRAGQVLPDFYGGVPPYAVTPLAAIRAKVGSGVEVRHVVDNTGGAAVKAAQSADVAIVVVGNHPTCGRTPQQLLQGLMLTSGCAIPSEGMEGSDRQSLTLEQEDLIKEVYQANPKTVVVLIASAPYAIDWTQQNVPAIIHMSHNSQEEGTAIADVLFGDYNPAGRLVETWPKSLAQLPPMMDYDIRHGRTYMYAKQEPLYPFGFGLSYTTFRYTNLRTSFHRLKAGGAITVSVDVTNTGARDGDEVVEFYVRHLGSKVDRPARELKGFGRVNIPQGQTRTVSVPLKAESLAYWDEAGNKFVVEPEPVEILAGASSADIRLRKTITVRR
ncbi:MAG: glycoside hydrolase family 3 C-terminal domain-containing protein [Bryobacteraceae bacterium]